MAVLLKTFLLSRRTIWFVSAGGDVHVYPDVAAVCSAPRTEPPHCWNWTPHVLFSATTCRVLLWGKTWSTHVGMNVIIHLLCGVMSFKSHGSVVTGIGVLFTTSTRVGNKQVKVIIKGWRNKWFNTGHEESVNKYLYYWNNSAFTVPRYQTNCRTIGECQQSTKD